MRNILGNGHVGVILAVLAFFFLAFPNAAPYPYADDWSYLPYISNGAVWDLHWIFAQHNDHRIPLQKVLHLALLWISGGDFRILIAANVIVIAATAVMLITFARELLGRRTWSEWFIPATLLSFGFNTVSWGFSFQFLSSQFFLALAALLWMRGTRLVSKNFVAGSYFVLMLCAWCGGNGLISSTVVGAGLLSGFFGGVGRPRLSATTIAGIAMWCATNLFIWLNWKSSAASAATAGLHAYEYFAFEMSKAWFGVAATRYPALSSVAGIAVIAAGLLGIAYMLISAFRRRSTSNEFVKVLPVFLMSVQSMIIVASVTLSRAGIQPWWPGLELHYGYLVTLLPVCAWLVIGRIPSTFWREGALMGIVAVASLGYVSNANWRMASSAVEYRKGAFAVADLLSQAPSEEVAHRHVKKLYSVDGSEAEATVSSGISLLRKMAFWHCLSATCVD